MSFRTRLTLLVAAAVTASVAVASIALFFLVSAQLRGEVDMGIAQRIAVVSTIMSRAATDTAFREALITGACPSLAPGSGSTDPSLGPPACPGAVDARLPSPRLGGASGYVELFDSSGHTYLLPDEHQRVPVTQEDRRLAAGGGPDLHRDSTVGGVHVRIATHPLGHQYALLVAQPLDGTDHVLDNLRLILLGVCVSGIVVAALLGRAVARTTLRPVHRLTLATEHVAGTLDLGRRIEEPGSDEVGRLARSFNAMMDALESSQRVQRQLVADASHELRTPLSSLRTNIELLARGGSLTDDERTEMLGAVVGQLERLGHLVGNLIDLARGDEPGVDAHSSVRLDDIVADAVEVARAHYSGVSFDVRSQPVVVLGDPNRIHRAISNLLDNAGKWSPAGATVDVRVGRYSVEVRDHGPGIASDDLPRVFDRFWRAPDASHMPGSGLGLSIVQQVAQSHSGEVTAAATPGGGATFRLQFPDRKPADEHNDGGPSAPRTGVL